MTSAASSGLYAIGCDVGTQRLKAVAIDRSGRVIDRASRSYPTVYPHPGWAEQDPRDWERALTDVVTELGQRLGTDGCTVVGIAGQVDGVVAVDEDDRPLAMAPIWMDRRAAAEARELADRLGSRRWLELTGLNADAGHGAPKIAWLRARSGELADADGYLLPVQQLVARITGERYLDHANASSTMLYDVHQRTWAPSALDALGIDEARLGRLAEAADVGGTIRPWFARATGMPEDCAVVVGTGDEHAACLAAGAVDPDVCCDITGTAEPVAAAATRPVIDPDGLVETHAHALPDRWLVENPGFVSGGSVRWLAESFLGVPEADIERLAADAPPGAGGVVFIPALGGAVTPRWDQTARGAFVGLSIGHDRRHLARAVLEGCAFALRDIVERLAALGLGGDRIRAVGGGARSSTWLRIKSDVTGRVIERLVEPEASAMGAALLAATGAGWFPDARTAALSTVCVDTALQVPDGSLADRYDEAYARYRSAFDALVPAEPTRSARPASRTAA